MLAVAHAAVTFSTRDTGGSTAWSHATDWDYDQPPTAVQDPLVILNNTGPFYVDTSVGLTGSNSRVR